MPTTMTGAASTTTAVATSLFSKDQSDQPASSHFTRGLSHAKSRDLLKRLLNPYYY